MRRFLFSAQLLAFAAAVVLNCACGDEARSEEIVEHLQLKHPPEANERNAHVAQIADFAFLPDGTLLTGGADGSLRHWNIETGQQLQLVAQQASPITRVALSPDGRNALSFSAIGAIRVWRLPARSGPGAGAATDSRRGRYQMSTHLSRPGQSKMFLLDTQTGSIWERRIDGGGDAAWKEIGPEALRPPLSAEAPPK